MQTGHTQINRRLCLSNFLPILLLTSVAHAASTNEILIGMEYAMAGMGKPFKKLGIPAVKHFPDAVAWGKMQTAADAPIDYSKLDRFVLEFQKAKFKELVIALRSQSQWASVDVNTNHVPKAQYVPLYESWISNIVERYDADGIGDVPGLRAPVRYVEIGTEFSSYEPESAADYLDMLEHAYQAAHSASSNVIVMHAAFLTTFAFQDHPATNEYEAAFAAVPTRIFNHGLDGMRVVLDRPDLFDAVNIHSIGDAAEIEEMCNWLRWEMGQRGYSKPIVISDTTPYPLIAWGPATTTNGTPNQLGLVIPPATESDRPKLAAFFTKLVAADADALAWTHGFVAGDMVKKVTIAAEQGVSLIDTSFVEDLLLFKLPLLQAGAGTSAWAGMCDDTIVVADDSRIVTGYRPSFYAVQQLQKHIEGYQSVERVANADSRFRLYKFMLPKVNLWVAWLEPTNVVILGDPVPSATWALNTVAKKVQVEKTITTDGERKPMKEKLASTNGTVEVELTPTPVFVIEKR